MSIHNPTRRNVLRGMFAAGCALILQRVGAAETPATMMEKSQVKYQDQPNDDQKCAGCMHFVSESNTCKLVAGEISPDGWCTLWTAKQG